MQLTGELTDYIRTIITDVISELTIRERNKYVVRVNPNMTPNMTKEILE